MFTTGGRSGDTKEQDSSVRRHHDLENLRKAAEGMKESETTSWAHRTGTMQMKQQKANFGKAKCTPQKSGCWVDRVADSRC